jgi:hypothetical protein
LNNIVMPGLVPGIYVLAVHILAMDVLAMRQDVDGRDKRGHDGIRVSL